MEEEKKPRRPRIGASAAASANVGPDGTSEARYDRAVRSGENRTSDPSSSQENGYQPRPYSPRPYSRPAGGSYDRQRTYGAPHPGGYQPRPGGYQPRYQNTEGAEAAAKTENTEGQQTSSAAPYQPRTSYNQRPGGYQQRPYNQRPYNQRPGGYQQRPYQKPENTEGTENAEGAEGQHNQHNSYQPRPRVGQTGAYGNRQGAYNNRQGGYNNRQQGGYGNRQGGYNNRQQGGYGNRQGGYNNNRQGGYNNRQQGGYGNRQGGYNNNRRPGYQANRPGGYGPQNQRPGMRFTPRPKQIDYVLEDIDPNEPIRLNKFMANSGICSRREADEHITAGLVKVNGETVTELGTKINRTDVVEYDGKVVTPERKCYVLLNKPKDCVTTSDDPNGRLTVLDLVKGACAERIYPVGRLDRNTTGVLLLTNDGDLASKLTHPKFVKKKIYQVWTDKDITEEDMQRIADGIELDDGEIHADAISYVNDTDRNQAGIEIHSGRNRIVRRIFESLGYRVVKLDRVYFAGLTKKNLPRGRWRYLTQEEVNYLRMGSFE